MFRALKFVAAAGLGVMVGCGASHWSYHGSTGPAHWGELKPEYAVARSGRAQSPIDIGTAGVAPGDAPPLKFEYGKVTVELFDNGHTVQADIVAPAGKSARKAPALIRGAQRFELQQFHVHVPSEHTVDGREYAGELHLVHQSKDGTLAVVGLLLEAGKAHPVLDRVWAKLPAPPAGHDGKPARTRIDGVDLAALVPSLRRVWRYDGSLTTPPCTEGVRWHVFAAPVELSSGPLEALERRFSGEDFPGGNRRPTQPLMGRKVVETAG